MKKFLLAALMACLAAGVFAQGKTVTEREIGLSKTDPFETPIPQPYALEAGKLRATPLGTPPVIPHGVESYLPITATQNNCLLCHGLAADASKKAAKGQPQFVPPSHLTKGADGKPVLKGTQYDCMLCHAPQANVKPLTGERNK